LQPEIFEPTKNCSHTALYCLDLAVHSITLSVCSPTRAIRLRACMSGDLSAKKKYVDEILIDLMDERAMSARIHASSMGGVQASPTTACHSSRVMTEKR
jgi:hypothetical protein